MAPIIKLLSSEEEELRYKARMTQIQFHSLSLKLKKSNLIEELKTLDYYTNFQKSPNCNKSDIKKWLTNGWNTEYLLRINYETLKDDALRNSLHWAFPQSYYSVFTICLAFFKVAGFTEKSHKAVMSKVGSLMSENKYPSTFIFLANGGINDINFINIKKVEIPSTIHFEETSEIIDTQICQFLKSTREMELEEKKPQMDIKTILGKKKKNFSKKDWEKVSAKIGLTSILNLLYRKRIKSNYRDIETFLCNELDPKLVSEYLISITAAINLLHEAFILKGLGRDEYDLIFENLNNSIKEIIKKREDDLLKIIF